MPAPTPAQAGNATRPLISQSELADRLASAWPPALLDVRWQLAGPPGLQSYLAGHLPGASFIDLDKDLSGPPGRGGRHPLPDASVFEHAMRSAGLRASQLAVAYDDGDGTIAARLWWMLRYYGHRPVAVLDGGYQAWAAAGRPVTADVPRAAPGDFEVRAAGDMPVLDDDGAAELARSGFLLDARAGDRYRGEAEPVDRAAGHIPGAISAPTMENVGPGGTFLTRELLERRFAGLGLPAAADLAAGPGGAPLVGAYCGSGVTAAHEVLALELAAGLSPGRPGRSSPRRHTSGGNAHVERHHSPGDLQR